MKPQPPVKKGDVVYDGYSKITCMAYADGWIMARRPRAAPFIWSLKDWRSMNKAKTADGTPDGTTEQPTLSP